MGIQCKEVRPFFGLMIRAAIKGHRMARAGSSWSHLNWLSIQEVFCLLSRASWDRQTGGSNLGKVCWRLITRPNVETHVESLLLLASPSALPSSSSPVLCSLTRQPPYPMITCHGVWMSVRCRVFGPRETQTFSVLGWILKCREELSTGDKWGGWFGGGGVSSLYKKLKSQSKMQ